MQIFSMMEEYIEYGGEYHHYSSSNVSTVEAYYDAHGGYHEYNVGCSVQS